MAVQWVRICLAMYKLNPCVTATEANTTTRASVHCKERSA